MDGEAIMLMLTLVWAVGLGLSIAGLKIRVRWPGDEDPCQNGTCPTCFGDNVPWPWCEACRSYHHPKNQTCVATRKN